MRALLLALIGLPTGLALDALIVRLAVAPDDEAEEPAAREGREEQPARPPLVQAEAGALVLGHERPASAWARRLLIAAATSGLFALAAARYQDPSHLALVCAYIAVLILCAATDALAFRVPNSVTYPAIVGALAAGALMPGADFWEVVAGGALAGGVLLAPALLTGGLGMGMGDVKLATFVGLALGFSLVAPALLLMALGGGAAAAFLLLSGRRRRGDPIPYAPFISAGALAVLLWQGAAFVRLG